MTQARSKPMFEIVNRLLEYGEFEVNIFGDDVSGKRRRGEGLTARRF